MQTTQEQMGWKDDDNAFLCGARLYTATQEIACDAVSPEIARRARMLGPRGGALSTWSGAANQLFAVGCEPVSFALCCAFGAPLVPFQSPQGGAIVNLVSEQSPTGKATTLAAVASVWGELEGIALTDDDTRVSRGLPLGGLGNLPCIFDEAQRRDPDAIRQLCLAFTAGRDGSAGQPIAACQTIMLMGSAYSLVDLLHKISGELHTFRILEFPCELNFTGSEGDKLRRILRENGGHAGHALLQFLMRPGALDWVRSELEVVTTHLSKYPTYQFGDEHHFWIRALACANVGGHIARNLDLLEFDPDRITNWAIERCIERKNRGFKKPNAEILCDALYDIWASTLVVDREWTIKSACRVLVAPTNGLHARRERANGRMYIRRALLHKLIEDRGASYRAWQKDLLEKRVILNTSKFVTLGAGVRTLAGGGQVICIEINMRHPLMAEALAISERDVKVPKSRRAHASAPSLPSLPQ